MERRRRERAEQVAYKLEQEIAVWDPAGIPNVTADPFKTLFVARIVSIYSTSLQRRIKLDKTLTELKVRYFKISY